MQSSCAILYCHLWTDWLYYIFLLYLINGTIFRKMLLKSIKCVFWFSLQLLSDTFLILKIIQQFHENLSSGSWVVPCRWTGRHDEANSHYSQFCECVSTPSYVNFTLKINIPLQCDFFMWSSNNFQNCTLFSGHMPDVWALRRLSVAPRWILGQFRSTESKACVAQLLGTIYKIKQVLIPVFWDVRYHPGIANLSEP